ncbi:MAG: CAP domain-containing protein [Acidobacteriota bacterium]
MKRAFLALLLLAMPAAAQPPAAIRQELLRLINAERTQAGGSALRLNDALGQAAQQHAGEISRVGNLNSGSADDMHRRMTQAGYQAHEWTENLISSNANPEGILRYWKTRNPSSFRSLMDPEYRDLGVGLSTLDGIPLYSFLFAVPQEDHFARETADLRERDRVRSEMIASVNAARKKAGLRPVTGNALLDKAAQRHAEDMLARGYFAHQSPSGTTVRERARSAGYDWVTIGENIAFGQTSVAEVMETWLDSPGHRKNILTPAFAELGVGVAMGRGSDGKYQIYWVQNFGDH